jgi:hypothetical protein
MTIQGGQNVVSCASPANVVVVAGVVVIEAGLAIKSPVVV